MNEFIKALKQLKVIKKTFTVTIEGQTIEVSLDKKLEIQRVGENNYMLQEGNIVRKPVEKHRNSQLELKKSDHGIVFLDHNPYWPIGNEKEGYKWDR